MYFRDLTPHDDAALMPAAALLRLPIRIGSRNPETALVRPISKRLMARDVASVTSWQVWTRGEGEVLGVELAIELSQPTRAGLADVAKALKSAPLGSSVRFRAGGEPLVFGGSEAVEVDLSDMAISQKEAAARCAEALGPAGQVRGWSVGAGRKKLYIYGPQARNIVSSITPVFGEVPTRPVP